MDLSGEAVNPQPQCRLLTLPPELRNAIYELVLCVKPRATSRDEGNADKHAINVRPSHDAMARGQSRPSVLNVLLTCRQIRYEADPLFYSLNTLRYRPLTAQSAEYSQPFLRSIGPRRLKALTALTIQSQSAAEVLLEIKCHLYLATHLSVLQLEFPLHAWNSEEMAMLWTREMQVLLRTTRLKGVRILHPGKGVEGLGRGGAGNNSYVFIRERARVERAWELSRVVEGMLNSIVQD